MKHRIELTGVTAEEFCRIFQCEGPPDIGSEIELQEGVRLTNLTSAGPNLVDGNIFVILVENLLDIGGAVALGLVTNYLYDVLKNKNIITIPHATKTIVEVKTDSGDKDEQV